MAKQNEKQKRKLEGWNRGEKSLLLVWGRATIGRISMKVCKGEMIERGGSLRVGDLWKGLYPLEVEKGRDYGRDYNCHDSLLEGRCGSKKYRKSLRGAPQAKGRTLLKRHREASWGKMETESVLGGKRNACYLIAATLGLR